MKKLSVLMAFGLLITAVQNGCAQRAPDKRQQYASIGDFALENGQKIIDCKVGYRTLGKLNENRSNAIIYLTPGGTTTRMMELFGVVAEVDTARFYLILMDAFGNGVSSSPSNSTSQPKSLFPQFSISDMVNAQYKVLTENLNIHHLAAVAGGSLGGLQALQWAVSYPDFMDKVVAIDATPKLSAYDLLWTSTYVEAVKSDTAYHGGNYTVNPATPLAAHLSQLVISTPAKVNSTVPADSFSVWFGSIGKVAYVDCNNFLWQTKATIMHDITAKAGGSLENTAKMIKAKMLVVANKQDHIFDQTLSIKLAQLVNAELVVMDSDLGHLIFSEKNVVEAARKFLSQ